MTPPRIFIYLAVILSGLLGCSLASVAPTAVPPALAPATDTPAPPPADPTATLIPQPTALPTPPSFTLTEIDLLRENIQACTANTAALLLYNAIEEVAADQTVLLAFDPTSASICRLTFANYFATNQIHFAAGNFYYAVYDELAEHYTIWQDDGLGNAQPLTFTQTPANKQVTYFRFLVSNDGNTVVWSLMDTTDFDIDQIYNTMWLAQRNAPTPQLLRSQTDDSFGTYLDPLRFTDDGYLLYAQQPLGLGGHWSSFIGRYQNLYQIELTGGEPTLIFDCVSLLCLGDISPDGQLLAYTDSLSNEVLLVTRQGDRVQAFSPPNANYVGYPTFAPDGRLFFTAAVLDDDLEARPGQIWLVYPPYAEPPMLYLEADDINSIVAISEDFLGYWHGYQVRLLQMAAPFNAWQLMGSWFYEMIVNNP